MKTKILSTLLCLVAANSVLAQSPSPNMNNAQQAIIAGKEDKFNKNVSGGYLGINSNGFVPYGFVFSNFYSSSDGSVWVKSGSNMVAIPGFGLAISNVSSGGISVGQITTNTFGILQTIPSRGLFLEGGSLNNSVYIGYGQTLAGSAIDNSSYLWSINSAGTFALRDGTFGGNISLSGSNILNFSRLVSSSTNFQVVATNASPRIQFNNGTLILESTGGYGVQVPNVLVSVSNQALNQVSANLLYGRTSAANTWTGIQTFLAAPIFPAASIPVSSISNLTGFTNGFILKTGDNMTGALNFGGSNNVSGLAAPVLSGDAVALGYAQSNFVSKSGDTLSGILSLSGNRITNVGNPTLSGDAVNLGYLSNNFVLLGSGITNLSAIYPLSGINLGGGQYQVSILQASASTSGYLSSNDWTTFSLGGGLKFIERSTSLAAVPTPTTNTINRGVTTNVYRYIYPSGGAQTNYILISNTPSTFSSPLHVIVDNSVGDGTNRTAIFLSGGSTIVSSPPLLVTNDTKAAVQFFSAQSDSTLYEIGRSVLIAGSSGPAALNIADGLDVQYTNIPANVAGNVSVNLTRPLTNYTAGAIYVPLGNVTASSSVLINTTVSTGRLSNLEYRMFVTNDNPSNSYSIAQGPTTPSLTNMPSFVLGSGESAILVWEQSNSNLNTSATFRKRLIEISGNTSTVTATSPDLSSASAGISFYLTAPSSPAPWGSAQLRGAADTYEIAITNTSVGYGDDTVLAMDFPIQTVRDLKAAGKPITFRISSPGSLSNTVNIYFYEGLFAVRGSPAGNSITLPRYGGGIEVTFVPGPQTTPPSLDGPAGLWVEAYRSTFSKKFGSLTRYPEQNVNYVNATNSGFTYSMVRQYSAPTYLWNGIANYEIGITNSTNMTINTSGTASLYALGDIIKFTANLQPGSVSNVITFSNKFRAASGNTLTVNSNSTSIITFECVSNANVTIPNAAFIERSRTEHPAGFNN